MNGTIIRNQHGAFCSACQSHLSIEEEDFETCDACDGDGIGCDGEDECPHEEYEADILTGIAACDMCGHRWILA